MAIQSLRHRRRQRNVCSWREGNHDGKHTLQELRPFLDLAADGSESPSHQLLLKNLDLHLILSHSSPQYPCVEYSLSTALESPLTTTELASLPVPKSSVTVAPIGPAVTLDNNLCWSTNGLPLSVLVSRTGRLRRLFITVNLSRHWRPTSNQ